MSLFWRTKFSKIITSQVNILSRSEREKFRNIRSPGSTTYEHQSYCQVVVKVKTDAMSKLSYELNSLLGERVPSKTRGTWQNDSGEHIRRSSRSSKNLICGSSASAIHTRLAKGSSVIAGAHLPSIKHNVILIHTHTI